VTPIALDSLEDKKQIPSGWAYRSLVGDWKPPLDDRDK
jgi:hypothetical protein